MRRISKLQVFLLNSYQSDRFKFILDLDIKKRRIKRQNDIKENKEWYES